MNYTFQCPKCDTKEERNIHMEEYDKQKDKQVCKCGTKMERVLEFSGGIELCSGMYGTSDSSWRM